MGVQVFRVGEVVYCYDSHVNTSMQKTTRAPNGLGQIKEIIDIITGDRYIEKEVLTGYGDKNTKVNLSIDVFATFERYNDNIWDISSDIDIFDIPINGTFNPHNVIKQDVNKLDEEFIRKTNNMKKRIDIINKYSMTRDDKIDKILD